MINKIYSHCLAVIITVMLVGGCAKYKPHSLLKPIGIEQSKENIKITASCLNEFDCRHYFSRRVLTKGYQPIQLYIQNNTDKAYVLDGINIDLPLQTNLHMARKLHLDTAKRIVSWGIAGLFLWPFLIPAAVEGIKSSEANKQLSEDFAQRVIDNNSYIIIPAHRIINKVMFIRVEDYTPTFDMALGEKSTNKQLEFSIKIS